MENAKLEEYMTHCLNSWYPPYPLYTPLYIRPVGVEIMAHMGKKKEHDLELVLQTGYIR